MTLPQSRKLEWEAELRFLLKEESRVSARITELKDMIREFFGETFRG